MIEPMTRKELKRWWVALINDAELEQCTEELVCDEEGAERSFCCLGVFAEDNSLWDDDAQTHVEGPNGDTHLPESLFEGVKCRENDVNTPEEIISRLIDLNDDECLDFPEIGAWIRDNLSIPDEAHSDVLRIAGGMEDG